MQEIQYIGEHLLPGKLGHLAVVLGFVASLLAFVAYFFATQRRSRPEYGHWRTMGRSAFWLHSLSVLTIIGVLFYVMVNKYYEYQYVFAHVNEDLPFQYIFSAFWEGQEGSFLLWMFWHVVLGLVLIARAGKWEAPVMSMVSLVQLFIGSMILGLYFGFGEELTKIGSNPVLLLRDTMDAPIFSNADYLSLIKGSGLNPLLQNYWMTIHPPTLFLGFASTTIPFAYAVAGLWTGEHKGWLRPALPWALFSGAVLGTGILMGGAWAYEALSFGGYWAWDPVENMSLVPWLVLIGGIHGNLIARNTGHSIRTTYFFYLLTFLLIVYSTFLTRSGVLGDTSVHAFTEMGLEWQLVGFLAFFVLLAAVIFAWRYKSVPVPEKEEPGSSKEFWMFIGALVLLLSAAMITASTSLPVYNKIRQFFDPAFEGRVITDQVAHFNKYQLMIGVLIGFLSGMAQYLRWREFNWAAQRPKFIRHTAVALAVTALLSLLTVLWIDLYTWRNGLLLFAGLFAVVTNIDYLLNFLHGNLKQAGSAFAHIGFGIMIVGVIASGLNQHHISTNPFAQQGLIDESRLDRNIMLFEDLPMYMSGYKVTYTGDTLIGNNRKYQIAFEELDQQGQVRRAFTLEPTALYDNKVTKVAAYNPDTKHFPHKDIFTHLASIPLVEADQEYAREHEDSLVYRPLLIGTNSPAPYADTMAGKEGPIVKNYEFLLEELLFTPHHTGYTPAGGDLPIGARIAIRDLKRDTVYHAEPMVVARGNLLYTYPVHVQNVAMKVRLTEEALTEVFPLEEELKYETLHFKQGETKRWRDWDIQFIRFNKSPEHRFYQPVEGDIAVGGLFAVQAVGDTSTYRLEPMYLIRDSRPFNLKDELREQGLHLRFTGLDPVEETIELNIAARPMPDRLPIEVAEAPRTDFVVLEAIVFPGINLFWLGSILMMFGLGFSMWNRIKTKANRDGA